GLGREANRADRGSAAASVSRSAGATRGAENAAGKAREEAGLRGVLGRGPVASHRVLQRDIRSRRDERRAERVPQDGHDDLRAGGPIQLPNETVSGRGGSAAEAVARNGSREGHGRGDRLEVSVGRSTSDADQ